MSTTLELLVTLLWIAFFLAAFLGVKHEYDQMHRDKRGKLEAHGLEDDDPVYLIKS